MTNPSNANGPDASAAPVAATVASAGATATGATATGATATGATATGATATGATATGATDKMPAWVFALTVAASLGFGFLLFVALPNVIAYWTLRSVTNNAAALNLFEGVVKLLIFVGYVWLAGRKPDIRRVFEFHGAEHKVVYAVENGREVSPDGARPFDTPHPRCGTGFALLTVLVSVLCFSFLPVVHSSLVQVAMRLALMPLVAGISYEIIKLTTHPRWGALVMRLMIPGLWLQRLTTRQPDDAQLEVACAAMRAVLAAENSSK